MISHVLERGSIAEFDFLGPVKELILSGVLL